MLRSQEEDRARDQSDIFICRLKKDDYWAYPNPFGTYVPVAENRRQEDP